MIDWKLVVVGSFAGTVFANACLDHFRQPSQDLAEKERAAIETLCELRDLSRTHNGQYDNHSAAYREGCKTAFMTTSLNTQNRLEGENRLNAAKQTETGHYAATTQAALHGRNP